MIITASINSQNRIFNSRQKKNLNLSKNNTAPEFLARKTNQANIYENNKLSPLFALSFCANNNIEVLKALENLDESLKDFDRDKNIVSLDAKTGRVKVTHNKKLEGDLNVIFNKFPVLNQTIERKNFHACKIITHLLEVTKEIVEYPEFKELPPASQRLARICALFHDVEKDIELPERGKDHPEIGAKTVVKEFSKLGFSQKELFAMHQIIKNHHWVGHLKTGVTTEDEIALEFKNYPEAFDISILLSSADINAGGNPDYLRDFKNIFHPIVTNEIKEKIKEL